MELKRAFRLTNYPRLALVGAGGKTSALFQLAREISPPVIVSATTHLAVEQIQFADQYVSITSFEDTNQLYEIARSGVILVTGPQAGTRVTGLPPKTISWLRDYCGYYSVPLLIEADGSRQLSLKSPAAHEPPIPQFCNSVVVVAGLSSIGKPLSPGFVHRPEIFAELTRMNLGDKITPTAVANALGHPSGGLKNIPPTARRIALLTQANDPELQDLGSTLAETLLNHYASVIIASSEIEPQAVGKIQSGLNSLVPVTVHEPVAGIILAAGEAKRFGSPKQLLDFHGKPFIWHVVQTALSSGLGPVFVVSGAYKSEIENALKDLPVNVIHNVDWSQGQGSSVRAGVQVLPPQTGAAIFMLADQPQIPSALVRKLKARHAETLAPIVAPSVAGRRANPVLFDRAVFGDLNKLEGDAGGRQLFSKYGGVKVSWNDSDILLDVDTPEDYQRLKEIGIK
jgi:molybdenum cofactor cytidylyltransferase